MEELIKRIKLGKWRNPTQIGSIDVGILSEILEEILERIEAIEDELEGDN